MRERNGGSFLEAMKHAADGKPERLNLSNIRLFGCLAYVRINGIPRTHKMEPRAEIGYLVGYVASNIWRIWFPHRQKAENVRDAVFDETKGYDPRRTTEDQLMTAKMDAEPVIIESDDDDENDVRIFLLQEDSTILKESGRERRKEAVQEDLIQKEEIPREFPTPSPTPEPVHADTPSGQDGDPEPHEQQLMMQLDAVAQSRRGPRGPRDADLVREENILTGRRTRRAREDPNFVSYLVMEDAEDTEDILAAFAIGLNLKTHVRPHRSDLPAPPANWKEMQKHPYREAFTEAASHEITTLDKMGTFHTVARPLNAQILPLKWVFTYKFDSDGYLIKAKARLCVRGDLQAISAEEKRAATLAARTARAVFALVCAFDLDTRQKDAINAFLNSYLDEEVYTCMPEGFGATGKCWKLSRALYGLRRSPRLWQQEVTQILKKLGLQPVPEDPCLFVKDRIIILVYVDDIIIVNHPSARQEAEDLNKALEREWDLRDLGETQWFLGIRIIRDRSQRRLWLCQDTYITSMANRYHLTDVRHRYDTPLLVEDLKAYEGRASSSQIHQYQQKVGSALYATMITRPDAARAVNKLSEFLTNPGPKHLDAIDRVIVYLYQTRFLAIEYNGQSASEIFTIASDASFGDNSDRKSTEGYLCRLFGGPIDWKASKAAYSHYLNNRSRAAGNIRSRQVLVLVEEDVSQC